MARKLKLIACLPTKLTSTFFVLERGMLNLMDALLQHTWHIVYA